MIERPEPKFADTACGKCGKDVAGSYTVNGDHWPDCPPESDFKCGLCGEPARGHAAIGDQRYCHGDDEPSPTCYMQATGVTERQSPVVTRNAMSPDDLWAMQEKPHVSDDAPDMGPIPGTEGIESDPPEYPERGYCEDCGVANPGETHDLRCKGTRQPDFCAEPENCHCSGECRQSPLQVHESATELVAVIKRLEAERDALRANVKALEECLHYALGGFATEDDIGLLSIFHTRYRKMWEKFYPPGGSND